jgi:sortase (surface protein transpeptidase)
MIFLIIAAALAGCGNKQTETAQVTPLPSAVLLVMAQATSEVSPTLEPTPTLFVLAPLFDAQLALTAAPVEVPLEIQIPSLGVNAPVLGVGLTSDNVMDAPKGPLGDAIWHTAYWFRGGGVPGEIGTATIAAHVDDPLGNPEIFANIQYLRAGDLIVIHIKHTTVDIRFIVDETKLYSLEESSDPTVLARIYGSGPAAGTGPQPATDGLSHLTLITCAGEIVNGEFDHYTVVYATLGK